MCEIDSPAFTKVSADILIGLNCNTIHESSKIITGGDSTYMQTLKAMFNK